MAIDRESDLRSIGVFLAIVFPPANGTQLQRVRRFERLVSATRATITNFNGSTHAGVDAGMDATDYKIRGAICHLHGFLMSFLAAANAIPKMIRTRAINSEPRVPQRTDGLDTRLAAVSIPV